MNLDVDITMDITVSKQNNQSKEDNVTYTFGDHVHVVDDAFFMPQLGKHRKIWIYLPKSYKHSSKKYPVLYMHDGQNLFHATPPRNDEWAVDSVIDGLIRDGEKEMIVVGIDHGDQDRMNEYNPYDSEHGKGEGKAYAQFIAETLKPYIDSTYRTLSDVKNTTIAGSSMGGLISMYAISAYPGIFGAAGIFSPSFWVAPDIFNEVEDHLSALKKSKIFFVAGDKEGSKMIDNVRKAYNLLSPDTTNPNIVFIEKEDGKHTEWFWHREFVTFYRFIAQ
ncbi:alpha/beta hydrolase [Pedobacter sp. BMA]|uniref:alpha/beta hydrolase n=1 Tax=Pedobacter sp. BMA TaxID=1663685 RepID=UPI000B14034F|nr:alpha/beta hydrolase-fold protein [Pedobacter sp. BMA]